MTVREAFSYNENLLWFKSGTARPCSPEDVCENILADFDDIFPFGYPTEQFIAHVKNDVHKSFIQLKEDKKKALAAMKRELLEGNAAALTSDRKENSDKDPGMIDEAGLDIEYGFNMHNTTQVRINTFAKVRDNIYN